MRRLLVALIIPLIMLVACGNGEEALGELIFCKGYERGTLEPIGVSSQFYVGELFHFKLSVEEPFGVDRMTLTIYRIRDDNVEIAVFTYDYRLRPEGDVFLLRRPRFFIDPGYYRFELVDVDGRLLAENTVEILDEE